jgi:hypothetical protein
LQVGAQSAVGQDIHVSTEKLLNVLLERDYIKQCSARLDTNEEIHVAVLMIITARDRAEYTYVADAMTCRGI